VAIIAALQDTSLDERERALLERFTALARERLGASLRAIWLFGSRARGEPAREGSDVDLLVIAEDASLSGGRRAVYEALNAAAEELGRWDVACRFVIHVQTPAWLRGRREIKSFFIAEVDRDKVVVIGDL
jgi:predicted nucleotidyltransferase